MSGHRLPHRPPFLLFQRPRGERWNAVEPVRSGRIRSASTNEHHQRRHLARLAAVIESRKGGDPDKSYVARLFAKGPDAILKKIGEEATETVMACGTACAKIAQAADLWFHSMLALARHGLARPTCWPN